MDNLHLIAAIGKNNELGKNNQLIWHIPEDLAFFNQNTINQNIIMGKNTFYSLPHLLKNRGHYVLSHDHKFSYQGVKVFHNYDDLLEQIKNSNEEFYVIGGASIYKLFINDVKDMLLTEIDDTCIDADTYFPCFNQNDWDKEIISKHTYNDIQYKHVKYLRR